MYQVGLFNSKDAPVVTIDQATRALEAIFGMQVKGDTIEAIYPEYGIWLVDLPADAAEDLEVSGFIEISRGDFRIISEMP